MIQSIQQMTLGRYCPSNSKIHQLDPRTKLICISIFMFMVFLIQSIVILTGLLILVFFIYKLAYLPARYAVSNVRPFMWLFLITLGIHAFSTNGHLLWQVPVVKWVLTREGIFAGIFYSMRIIILIATAGLLTLTTSPMSLTLALVSFLKPFKRIGIPVNDIAMMISIAMRFIPIFIDEAIRIQQSQMSRGAVFTGNLVQRIKSTIPVIIPLFISTFRKAHDLALAMEARCYQSGKERTSYEMLRFQSSDYVTLVLSGVFWAVCVMI